MDVTPSKHFLERWEYRFPGVDFAEAFADAVPTPVRKLQRMMEKATGRKQLKPNGIYLYSRKFDAVFVMNKRKEEHTRFVIVTAMRVSRSS